MQPEQLVMQARNVGQFAIPPQDVLQDATHMWLAEQPYVAPEHPPQVGTHVRVESQVKVAPAQPTQVGRHASASGQ